MHRIRWSDGGPSPTWAARWAAAQRNLSAKTPAHGAAIYYSLGKKAEKISLKVLDFAGQTMRELATKDEPGLHRVVWDMRRPSTRTVRDMLGGQTEPAQAFRRGLLTADVPPGQYRVVLTVDGKEFSTALRIEADPTGVSGASAVDMDEDGDPDADRDPDKDLDFDPDYIG